jgi:16S rRNA (adenine1518-N6/adenine1519-N6)-dimethyltransferase
VTQPVSEPRPPRPPWREFKAALDAAGFHPSRRLGQNFLLDENVARAIAEDACLGPDEFVLEVGPGCGFLSVHLAHGTGRLLAVEIDPRLAPIAARFLEPYPGARVLVGDMLAGKRALNPEVAALLPDSGPWHLVSNLPYSVGGPILALLAGRDHPPDSMTVLVQAEVAQRLAAQPGTRAWGPLTVGVRLAYRPRILRRVPPGLFWPRPKVDSAVIRFERLEDLPPALKRERTRELAGKLLQRRRQTVGRVLGDLLEDRERAQGLLGQLDIDGGQRSGDLDLKSLATLAAAVAE